MGKEEQHELLEPYLPYNLENEARVSKRFKRICVFCGSSNGKKDIFNTVAYCLGRELVCLVQPTVS